MHRLFLLATLLGFVAPALAQPATLPADLFYAVARITAAERVAVGEAPDRLVGVLPAGAEVVGTVYGGGSPGDEEGAYVVGRVPQDPDAASLAYESGVPQGWHRLDDPGGNATGGFLATGFSERGAILCRDGDPEATPVRVGFSERPGGGAFVTASSGGWTRRGCDGEIDESPPFGPRRAAAVEIAEVPVLSAPPGGRQSTQGSGGGMDNREQDAALTWDGAADGALGHYAELLEAAGWAAVATGGDADIAAGTWTRAADTGPRTVSIAVVRTGPLQFGLRLHLVAYPDREDGPR
ncbi:hypothetical protein [Rubrivirga sp. IMCC43871]|uniref:hypothetical protein n=1 Tax=Rubrivirga sp. IMCC43871 TaxID=3391575 RepID=UPI00398FD593